MRFTKFFSGEATNVFDTVEWANRHVKIESDDGKQVLFEMNVEAPVTWSDRAVSILASKYLQKDGRETSLRQVITRMVGCWCHFGERLGYFTSQADLDAFAKDVTYMLLHQMAAPNSPQWFNTGVEREGSPQEGNFYIDHEGTLQPVYDAYSHPQAHACFIQPVEDKLTGEGSIMDLWEREARLFKFGSGTGTNFSNIRAKGEPLANGGTSAGLMEWLKIGDRAAGCIKSGGTTRRAAKMVVLDVDHPEIMEFIRWKKREEMKLQAMVFGAESLSASPTGFAEDCKQMNLVLDHDFNGEAYQSISGQNSNNSVRVTDNFMQVVDEGGLWHTVWRTDPKNTTPIRARDIWEAINDAAWSCADPGLQFHDTINLWHTCQESGPIRASNPCSEYMFLDNTACNLASINLVKFYNSETDHFDISGFGHAVRLWTVVLDISVSMAQYPSREIAQKSVEFRTLGLGWTNFGCLLMQRAIPYDSQQARDFGAAITSLMTAISYETSSAIASELGVFPGFSKNEESMRGVIRLHHAHAGTKPKTETDKVIVGLYKSAESVWESCLLAKGFRNAQTTLLAPTGTIALVMDCETTGVEPYFALTAYKKLSGGGTIPVVCDSVVHALRKLKYPEKQIDKICKQLGKGTPIENCDIASEHLPVFATAAGSLALSPESHVYMMGALQPFLSGAISKTVNLPANATRHDVATIHRLAWTEGLKSIAIYRDGCKMSQPMNVSKSEGSEIRVSPRKVTKVHRSVIDEVPMTPSRRKLPDTRKSCTHKFKINGVSGFVTVGEFEDGTPGEVFIRMSKAGSTVHGFCETIGRSWSMLLQYGVPVKDLLSSFQGVRFEPHGMTMNKEIAFTSSVVDYVVNWLDKQYPIPCRDDISRAIGSGGKTVSPDHPVDATGYMLAAINSAGPACMECGNPTVRVGACFQCNNCGSTTGCG